MFEVFFESYRKKRAKLYEGRDPAAGKQKRRALVTMVHNEAVFLPIWLRYYSRFFRPEDIYVLDHETTDGSTDVGGFVRIPVTHDSVDHVWMVHTIQELQHDLIDRYEVVLVTDVDELVAPDPTWGTLGDYIDRLDEEFVSCRGFELVHMRDEEPPILLDEPILDQRSHWFCNGWYNKPNLTMAPTEWEPGFHARVDQRVNYDPDLYLIHLHRMDYEICLARHKWRRTRQWNDRDVADGWAYHNRITDDAEFARWFYEDSGFPDTPMVIERMPPEWRGVF